MDLSDADLSQAVSDVGARPIGVPQAVAAIPDNPDKAAQAQDLSDATGVHPEVIHNDLGGFKAGVKAIAASSIVAANPTLGGFVANPMAARVSNDDLSKLDEVSGHVQAAAAPTLWNKVSDFLFKPDDFDKSLAEGFGAGFDLEGQRKELEDLVNYSDSPAYQTFLRNGGFLWGRSALS